MVTSALIIVVSAVLFAYWFRYSCLLILTARTARDYSSEVAASRSLGFLEVRGKLAGGCGGSELDALHRALRKDYALLASITRHTLCLGAGRTIESLMVRLDYHLLRAWYALARLFWPEHARTALTEMTEIVRYFANTVGEHSRAL